VVVEGAEPGDALQITVRHLIPGDWGWTANLLDFGLLSEDFPEPELKIWRLDPVTFAPAEYMPGIHVPLKPFLGTMGCVPAAEGRHDALPPRLVGGNLDLRDCGVDSVLWLPVEVAGALFSCGDAHAAQGDGEVCGTAIETSMTAALRLDLVKAAHLRLPRFEVSTPVTRHLDGRGYEVTMGIGADLFEAARTAVREMIELLAATRGLPRVAAYMLCSVCADLRISEIVDRPNWVVSLYLPKVVFN
jgi:acetamidase/formamidase